MAEINKYLNLEGLAEVAEKVNKKLRIVTTMPSTPEADDIVLYNGATTADYQQGSTYLYTVIETYYKWSDLTDDYYTKSETPTVGDTVYSDTSGTDSGYTIEAFDSTNNEVTINSLIYTRDTTGDTDIYDWIAIDGTSIILNDEDVTGDEANFYAPTTAGTEGQYLVSRGANLAPQWADGAPNGGYSPSFLSDSLVFAYGVLPEVQGNALIFDIGND